LVGAVIRTVWCTPFGGLGHIFLHLDILKFSRISRKSQKNHV
jgi:hypothetical protein